MNNNIDLTTYFEMMSPEEKRWVDIVIDRVQMQGGLYRCDQFGNPVYSGDGSPIPEEIAVCPTRRWCIDRHGLVWRYFAKGSSKDPQNPTLGGAPYRGNMVEMWSGRWRQLPDGEFAKATLTVSMEPGVNQRGDLPRLDWYRSTKNFKHPLEAPHAPDEFAIASINRQAAVRHHEIRSAAQSLGVEAAKMLDAESRRNAPSGYAPIPDDEPEASQAKRETIATVKAKAAELGVDVSDISGKGALAKIKQRIEMAQDMPTRSNRVPVEP